MYMHMCTFTMKNERPLCSICILYSPRSHHLNHLLLLLLKGYFHTVLYVHFRNYIIMGNPRGRGNIAL